MSPTIATYETYIINNCIILFLCVCVLGLNVPKREIISNSYDTQRLEPNHRYYRRIDCHSFHVWPIRWTILSFVTQKTIEKLFLSSFNQLVICSEKFRNFPQVCEKSIKVIINVWLSAMALKPVFVCSSQSSLHFPHKVIHCVRSNTDTIQTSSGRIHNSTLVLFELNSDVM